MGFLNGKRALITGLASDRSIAWGIAQAMGREGAELALTYQNEKLKPRVDKFAQSLGSTVVLPCDVGTDSEIDSLFDELAKHWDALDILVHSIAFAPREELKGSILMLLHGRVSTRPTKSVLTASLPWRVRPSL